MRNHNIQSNNKTLKGITSQRLFDNFMDSETYRILNIDTMKKFTAQFKIEGELLTANGDLYSNAEITELIVRRLRNRSADFDKLIEDDGDGDVEEQLHDQDLQIAEEQAATLVDITLSVTDEVYAALESDRDLVYLKAISELENGKIKLFGDETQNNVSHLSFE